MCSPTPTKCFLEETFVSTPLKEMHVFYDLTCSAIHPPRWCWCELLSSGDLQRCLSSVNIMELDSARLVGAQRAKNIHLNISTEIVTQLLEIIHKPCCEKFHGGTIFFLYQTTPYHCSDGNVRLLTRLELVSARDVNSTGALFGWDVTLAS